MDQLNAGQLIKGSQPELRISGRTARQPYELGWTVEADGQNLSHACQNMENRTINQIARRQGPRARIAPVPVGRPQYGRTNLSAVRVPGQDEIGAVLDRPKC